MISETTAKPRLDNLEHLKRYYHENDWYQSFAVRYSTGFSLENSFLSLGR